MDSLPFMGNSTCSRKKMMEELVQGHDFAAQLQVVIHDQLTGTPCESKNMADDLITKIMRTFSEALSILRNADSDPPCRNQRRKPLKRRKMQESWIRITSAAPYEDGSSWRKYGQKEILNAKHLRNYYRCSNKLDQGCEAAKQVQRIEDEPPVFWTKYVGHHTCQVKLQQESLGMDSTTEEGLLTSFRLNTTTTTEHEPPFVSSSFPSTKEEHEKFMTTPSIEQQEQKPPLSSEYYFPPSQDMMTHFLSSMNPASVLPSTSKPASEDGGSSFSTSIDMDIEMMHSILLDDAFYDELWF